MKAVNAEIAESHAKVQAAKGEAIGFANSDVVAKRIAKHFQDFEDWDRQQQKQALADYIERIVVPMTELGPEFEFFMKVGLPIFNPWPDEHPMTDPHVNYKTHS